MLGLAVQRAQQAGALVIAGVGNDGVSTNSFYPAAYPGVLGVAATDENNAPASFSNSGPVVDVAAPGVGIISTYNPDSPENTTRALYARFSGTSYAAPHVAGVAALVKAKNPDLTEKGSPPGYRMEQPTGASRDATTRTAPASSTPDAPSHQGWKGADRGVAGANRLNTSQLAFVSRCNLAWVVRRRPPSDLGA